ncbi:MAG: single-stranded-DNA-specific exonuclease RecJ [bacterium]
MKWVLREAAPPDFFSRIKELPKFISNILWQRGLREEPEISAFLNPSYEAGLHDPFLFSHMKLAVRKCFEALEGNKRVVIHGDYDADGVTGTAVMFETLMNLKTWLKSESEISVYLPHREKEGYGLKAESVQSFKERGISLIITVDCGIANTSEIRLAYELGLEVIVIDHHAVPEVLDERATIIHPGVKGETYPFKHLAAAGVAFKVASALLSEARERELPVPFGSEKWLLDLVAIASVTDIVPLKGENRVLEYFGLTVLRKTRRPGLKALYQIAGIDPGSVETNTIGFQIGPRLNAAGRLEHAKTAFDLLIATDGKMAEELALKLNLLNQDRQRDMKVLFDEALKDAEAQLENRVILIAKENWPHGLVGLIASKLTSTYHLPSYVIGVNQGGLVGSGRGIPGFNVTLALEQAGDFLIRSGGHPLACGFTVKSREHLEGLFAVLKNEARQKITDEVKEMLLLLDSELDLETSTLENALRLDSLKPFGEANAKPLFLLTSLKVVGFSNLGATGQHLRIQVEQSGLRRNLIGFGLGPRVKELGLGTVIDAVSELGVNVWQGNVEPQLSCKDFRISK